jgi:PAS domain S-box-containing protein
LLRALATTGRLSDLLPLLHEQAVNAVHGRGAILFQFDPTGEWLQATAAVGVDPLPAEPWLAGGGLVPHALFRDGRPLFVPDLARSVRGVAEYLGTPSAVLIPLAWVHDRLGVLVVGCLDMPEEAHLQEAALIGHAFSLALERARGARDADLQRALKALLHDFSQALGSSMNLGPGFEALCRGANRLFAGERSSVWLHDRRVHSLALFASSDAAYLAQARQISTADALAPPAVALRRERAEVTPGRGPLSGTWLLTIPLKGRRRALGAFVVEQVRLDPGSERELLERADEMGRQLSVAIENALLLEDVLRSRRELDNTLNSLSDLVMVCGRDGRVVHVNRAFCDRTGHTRRELLDRPLGGLVASGTEQLMAHALSGAPDGPGRVVSVELEDAALHGTFLMTVTPLSGEHEQQAGAVLVARDVTPHAQLEAERAELRNKLVQSEKLAALGQFVAGIAHELNNPLQGVLGHLELLRATGAFPKALRRDMQRVYREADRAAKIVRNLLVFAGSRRLVRRRTSVNAVLSRALAFRAPAFRAASIEVVRRHDEGLPRVKGDPLLLQQAFLNIVLNAEQAVGLGGRIETRTNLLPDTGMILVEIRDTGAGIGADVLSRIFEPFYTTKEVGKGTGLGLAIAYGIIQEHGGQISASNHPDGGAVFTVQLPVEPG